MRSGLARHRPRPTPCWRKENAIVKTDDLLMCPGPNDIAERVLRAMLRPAACPVTPEFQEFYERTLDMLAAVYQTRHQVAPIPGSGRSGIESAITSVIEPGDRALVIICGNFGHLAARVVNGVGGQADEVEFPWGEALDLGVIRDKLAQGSYKLVTLVHNETSSGAIYNDAGEVARLAHEHGALMLLDAISSLGGADLPTDAWDIDLCVSCNHKAIAAPIGHAYVAVSERAWQVMERRKEPCRNIFGNLLHWKAQPLEHPSDGRALRRPQGVFTAVHLFYALHEALAMILEEGLEARFARHILNARAFRAGIQALGLRTLARPELASPTVTGVLLPEGMSSTEFLRRLHAEHGIFTLPGLGPYRDIAIRIGHMGVTAAPRCILHTLYAIESVLTALGRPVAPGTAVQRAEQVYAEAAGRAIGLVAS
jgi:aspartate aminotransferase-like enzyme